SQADEDEAEVEELGTMPPAVFNPGRPSSGAVPAVTTDDPGLRILLDHAQRMRERTNPPAEPSPLPGTDRVAVGGFASLAILFAVVVGPLNLWWLRKRRARHLFLVTTPALSLATCACLIVYSLVSEGMELRRRIAQITWLDPGGERAVAWTQASYYGGFSVASMPFDADAEVVRLSRDDYHGYGYRGSQRDTSSAFTIDWHQGQTLRGDWLPGRQNSHLLITERRPERARVQIARRGEGWEAVNGLGPEIVAIAWRDPQGGLWQADHLAFGAATPLTALADDADALAATPGGMGPVAEHRWSDCVVQPGWFRAQLAAPLGVLPGPAGEDVMPARVYACGLAVLENPR
ncbi:MAG: hypothetical protein H0W72_14195, partial [Planctomycetes bacterium]|nr:hypothetical protein [Planctomycetota bacterium]